MFGFAAVLLLVPGCSQGQQELGAAGVITSTTKIAGAGVLGNQRRPDDSCAAEPARADPGPATRWVHNPARINSTAGSGTSPETAAGAAEVSAEPQRIVVLAGDQLDALCALGLQSRVVAAALPDDSEHQPAYLGAVVHDLPAVGTRSAPDLAAIKAARPDLILGSTASPPQLYAELARLAPTVFTGTAGGAWQDGLRGVGVATARTAAADELLERFDQHAQESGAAHDATHFQASVVSLTETSVRVYGSSNFPGSVLSAVGLDRPAAQRFTDRSYIEISSDDLAGADFSAADGDIVYVSFTSAAAKTRADAVLDSPAWRKLSANRDNRVFVVNNEVWHTGQGLVAARGIVDDLRWVDAPIN